MSEIKERSVPFTTATFDAVMEEATKDKRTFKNEAAVLIEEALMARSLVEEDGNRFQKIAE